MKPISFIKDLFEPIGEEKSIMEMYYDIRFGVFREKVEAYRETKKQSIKYSLPAYCLGTFSGRIENDNLKQVGYFGYDIDDYNISNVWERVKAHPNILMAYKSVSGTGFWLICKGQLLADASHYSHAWKIHRNRLSSELGIPLEKFDKTSDVRRAMFLSFDENAYFNKDSKELQYINKPKTKPTVKQADVDINLDVVVDLLAGKVNGYYEWFRIGSILTKFDGGEDAFVRISTANSNYRDDLGYIKRKFKQLQTNIVYFNQASIIVFMKDFGVWNEYKKRVGK